MKRIDSLSIVGKQFGDVIVLELISIGTKTTFDSEYNCKCTICGSEFKRTYQTLRRNPKHNRYCYGGLYNDIPWKENYSWRYHNILKRCKDSKYYNNVACNLSYSEFMNEIISLQIKNNISNKDMLTLTIDRIDNNINYCSGNLRLVNMLTQVYNRRKKPNCFITKINNIDIISNSVALTSEQFNLNIAAVNNCLSGRSKSHSGIIFEKISEELYYNIKSVTTKFRVIHKDYF